VPLHLGNVVVDSEYVLYYQRGKDTIVVCAPNVDDAKELFVWLKAQTGL